MSNISETSCHELKFIGIKTYQHGTVSLSESGCGCCSYETINPKKEEYDEAIAETKVFLQKLVELRNGVK